MDSKLEELGDRLDKAEAKGTDESFSMEQFNFASYGDFVNFMLTNKIPSCGMFWDIFSTLVLMRPKGQSGKERADKQRLSERINTSMLENNLLAAMGRVRPGCLYASKGESGMLVDSKKGFGAITSHEKWRAGVDSIKRALTKQLKDFMTGVNGNMKGTDGGFALAKQLLIAVKEQWYKLVSWIDEFYKQLTAEANFKAEPAWRLVGRCVAAVFDMMAYFRAKVALIEDPKPLENKSKIIWCALQCHMVMERFMAVKFQGHPVIVKEITMSMVTERVDPDEVTAMQTKVNAAKTALATANRRVSTLEHSFNEIKQSYNNHIANAFRNLKDKVHKVIACVNVGTTEKPVYHGGGGLASGAPHQGHSRPYAPHLRLQAFLGQSNPFVAVMNFWYVTMHHISWSPRYSPITLLWIPTF
jgi:hypothetical protein